MQVSSEIVCHRFPAGLMKIFDFVMQTHRGERERVFVGELFSMFWVNSTNLNVLIITVKITFAFKGGRSVEETLSACTPVCSVHLGKCRVLAS